jgi:hypothetical protein
MATRTLETYPYLLSNVLWLTAVLLAVVFPPLSAQRRLILRQGLLGAVFFPFAAVANGEYWSPVRMAGFGLGIEDMFCAFNLGATAGLLAVLPFRRNLPAYSPAPRLGRLVCAGTFTLSLFFLVRSLGSSTMTDRKSVV